VLLIDHLAKARALAVSAAAFGLGLIAFAELATAAPAASPNSPPHEAVIGQLDTLREESVAAARNAQQHERAIGPLQRDIDLLSRDAEGTSRGLTESRAEQAQLLGVLQKLARNPPERFVLAPEAPLDRIRSGMLIAVAVPALQEEAHALVAEIGRLATLRRKIEEKRDELKVRREALSRNHELLAHMSTRRTDLTREILREDSASATRTRELGEKSADLRELIKQTDAEADRRDKDIVRATATAKSKTGAKGPTSATDPTRPKTLRVFDGAEGSLAAPVTSDIKSRFGKSEGDGPAGEGLNFASNPGTTVVAPFDGQVDYAGRFRNYGVVLIIRHGGAYHSVLAGLGRVDVNLGEWVLAGEPVGEMLETATSGSGVVLHFEMRRDGRPIDPQPLLVNDSQRTGNDDGLGKNRVRE
jgi:septal ring factor EnvC (AmiA/AmiB activator)